MGRNSKASIDAYQSSIKGKATRALYRASHKNEIAAADKIYIAEHKTKIESYRSSHKTETKARSASYYKLHKSKKAAQSAAYYRAHKEEARIQGIAWRTGSSPEEVIMWSHKERICWICGELAADVLDHDHKTGNIRGWAHRGCNLIEGMVGASPDPHCLLMTLDLAYK